MIIIRILDLQDLSDSLGRAETPLPIVITENPLLAESLDKNPNIVPVTCC
jgi:hypothetical protein